MPFSVLSNVNNPTEAQLRERQKELSKVDGSKYGNDSAVEMAWAQKAFRHTEVYFKLISNIECTKLNLTKHDDEIHSQFLMAFPRVPVAVLDEDRMKSVSAKRRWRAFCNLFEHHIDDYNFGTLLRLDCKEGYSESNTMLVPRVQFLAIEIARNRLGLNMCHFGKKAEEKKEEKKEEQKKEEEKDVSLVNQESSEPAA